MQNYIFAGQFGLALAVAASTAWMAQTWRQEGKVFVADQERNGGIEKARLVSEGQKTRNEIIERYESEARAERGRIEGLAAQTAKTVEEEGRTIQVGLLTQGDRAKAEAADTLVGLKTAADRFKRLSERGGKEASVYGVIHRYLESAAKGQDGLRGLASLAGRGTSGSCSQVRAEAMNIATRVEYGTYTGAPYDKTNLLKRTFDNVGITDLEVLKQMDTGPQTYERLPVEPNSGSAGPFDEFRKLSESERRKSKRSKK